MRMYAPKKKKKGTFWFYKTGLTVNESLRSVTMRFHARLHHVRRHVAFLTDGLIKDTHDAVSSGKHVEDFIVSSEIEQTLDVLRDIDDLLALDFKRDTRVDWWTGETITHYMSIGELAQIAACPWEPFIDSYVSSRHKALTCKAVARRRRELILAAANGVDGLEVLVRHLENKINANDLLLFKTTLLFLNGLSCFAQFAWSDYVMPLMTTTTPVPSWQQQIEDLHGRD